MCSEVDVPDLFTTQPSLQYEAKCTVCNSCDQVFVVHGLLSAFKICSRIHMDLHAHDLSVPTLKGSRLARRPIRYKISNRVKMKATTE